MILIEENEKIEQIAMTSIKIKKCLQEDSRRARVGRKNACAFDKRKVNGLGYGIQSNAEVLGYEEEISRGSFFKVKYMYKMANTKVQKHLPPHLHYQEAPYVLPSTLRVPVTHNDPRDPYVVACDATTAPATDKDDPVAREETSPSEPQGSPPRDS
ncbi:hypothetical protein Tco_0862480 [Tanacetum coccineum]